MEFNKTKMQKMRKVDKLIDFMIRDLMKRGHDEEYAMEVVFNSEILGDTVMEEKNISIYKRRVIMFNIVPIIQRGSDFDGMLYKGKEDIGGVGKDDKGIYINLKRELTVHETIELLKVINGLQMDFFQLKVEINYISRSNRNYEEIQNRKEEMQIQNWEHIKGKKLEIDVDERDSLVYLIGKENDGVQHELARIKRHTDGK